MIHPCPTKARCVGDNFLGDDTPFANLSAEKPDVDLFLGSNFGWDLNIPKLGWTWTDVNDVGFCYATTQQLADICSQNQQLNNQVQTWRNPNTNPNQPPQLFFNQQVSCPFVCPDGLQFVWVVAAGQFQALDQETADGIARDFACKQALRFYICLGSLNTRACVGSSYSSKLSFTGGKAPINVSVTNGALPPGLAFTPSGDGKSATLSGTPTTSGNFSFTVTATDQNSNFMSKTFTLFVLGVSNISSVPQATENTAYSFQLQASGGVGPYTFSLQTGSLDGLSLSSTGLISGTPAYATAQSYDFVVLVSDSTGNNCVATGTLKVVLRPGPDWTQLTWPILSVVQNLPNHTAAINATKNTGNGTLFNADNTFNVEIGPVASSVINYTGPDVICRARLTISAGGGTYQLAMHVWINGVATTIINQPNAGPGVYDVDFHSGALVTGTIQLRGGLNDLAPNNNFLAELQTANTVTFGFVIFNV